jgi:hypothetical protein
VLDVYLSNMSFASLIFAARYGEPPAQTGKNMLGEEETRGTDPVPRSGWLAIISFLCAVWMRALSACALQQ